MANRRIKYEQQIRTLHAEGYTDSEIGKVVGVTRVPIGVERRQLGLESNRLHERYRERQRQAATRQCESVGVPNLALLRVKAHRDFALRNGWPGDLRPREVMILNALLEHGPMTRPQICKAVGLTWRGSNNSMKSGHCGGSHLAILINRGLVVFLGKIADGLGVYSLALEAEPLPLSERMQ